LVTTRDSRAASRMPSSRSNSQARVCFASSRRCSRIGEPGDDALQMRKLLVEQMPQPAELV
jgi:hypothetical protein